MMQRAHISLAICLTMFWSPSTAADNSSGCNASTPCLELFSSYDGAKQKRIMYDWMRASISKDVLVEQATIRLGALARLEGADVEKISAEIKTAMSNHISCVSDILTGKHSEQEFIDDFYPKYVTSDLAKEKPNSSFFEEFDSDISNLCQSKKRKLSPDEFVSALTASGELDQLK